MFALLTATALAGPPLVVRSKTATPEADPAKAVVVFIRPNTTARAIKPAILDEAGRVIAEVRVDSWVAAKLDPGPHTLVSWGESTPTLKADLEAGEVYYVKVANKMGSIWTSRFVLEALGPTRPGWDQVGRWTTRGTRGWEVDEQISGAYATLRKADIDVVLQKSASEWAAYSDAERTERTLTPDDGVTEPLK
jgi:hypothetical protein